MFIPLKDTNPALRKPLVTYGLIAANISIFLKIGAIWFIGIWIVTQFLF